MIPLGVPRHFFETLDSTMDAITALARTGAPEGTLVVAAEQRAGRGRAGRIWSAPRGSALLCSLLLRPPLPPRALGALPLVAGLAVAEAIDLLIPVRSRLKWPNDVFLGDRKVSGILMQSRASGELVDFVNLGIGINVSAPSEALPPGATSLKAATGCDVPIEEVERALLNRLTAGYAAFTAMAGLPPLDPWLDRAMYLGERVEIEQAGVRLSGTFTGITTHGALLLDTAAGLREITAGDLTRGPRLGDAE